jgi:hypothetical protein
LKAQYSKEDVDLKQNVEELNPKGSEDEDYDDDDDDDV